VGLLDTWLGQSFRCINDGRMGTLVKDERGFAIEHVDRGETLKERVNQQSLLLNWTNDLRPSKKLLDEEIERVANVADRALQALVRHEPFLFHEMAVKERGEIFDAEFHKQICQFLREKYDE
jgi:hypothetical protein